MRIIPPLRPSPVSLDIFDNSSRPACRLVETTGGNFDLPGTSLQPLGDPRTRPAGKASNLMARNAGLPACHGYCSTDGLREKEEGRDGRYASWRGDAIEPSGR